MAQMTAAQYRKILRDSIVELAVLDGQDAKTVKASMTPLAGLDIGDLKKRQSGLRDALDRKGVEWRNPEQEEKIRATLLDEVERLANAGGHDGAAKRGHAEQMSIAELRKLIAATRDFMERKARRLRREAGRVATSPVREVYKPGKATPDQVAEIMRLLKRRKADGEGGGFMVGPTDPDGVQDMSQEDASGYIDSLRGEY